MKPLNIILCLEGACNLRCQSCNIWHNNVQKSILPLPDRYLFIRNIKKYFPHLPITLFAGEPLMHPHTIPLLVEASKINLDIFITTNGTLLTDTMVRKICLPSLAGVIISIDGPKNIHDKLRGVVGTYDKAVKGILCLRKYCASNMKIVVETLLTSENTICLQDFMKIILKYPIDGILFQAITSKYGFGSPFFDKNWYRCKDTLFPKYDDIRRVIDKIIFFKREGYPILNDIDDLLNLKKYFYNPITYNSCQKCMSYQNLLITTDGKLATCPQANFVGDAYKDNYAKAWTFSYVMNKFLHSYKCKLSNKILLCNSKNLARMMDI